MTMLTPIIPMVIKSDALSRMYAPPTVEDGRSQLMTVIASEPKNVTADSHIAQLMAATSLRSSLASVLWGKCSGIWGDFYLGRYSAE